MKSANCILLLIISLFIIPAEVPAQKLPHQDLLYGKAMLETGNVDSALYYLDRAQLALPSDADVAFQKGLALFEKKQYRMAINEFGKVEKSQKNRASIWIARCYANLNDSENCILALDAHLNSNYRLPESTLLLDKDLNLLENDPKYTDFWKKGTWYTPYDQILAEAGYLIKSQNYPDAINLITKGIDKGFRKPALYAKRAEVYHLSGNTKLALEDLSRSIDLDSRNPDVLTKRAMLNYETGKFKSALEDYNAALRLNPGELGIYVGRSLANNKNGFYEQAIMDMKVYLSYYPGNDTAWFHLGIVYFDHAEYFDALNCFNKSLKINQNEARYFAARGSTYLKTRTYAYAWKDFSMALDLNPRDAESYTGKGIAAINTGNLDDACFCFEAAKRLGSREAYDLSEKYCNKR